MSDSEASWSSDEAPDFVLPVGRRMTMEDDTPKKKSTALRLRCDGCGKSSFSLDIEGSGTGTPGTKDDEENDSNDEKDGKEDDKNAGEKPDEAKPRCRIGRYARLKKGEEKELIDDTEWKRPPDPARDLNYAIVVEEKVSYDYYGNETGRKELLTLVSPALVTAFNDVVKHFPGIGLNGGKVTLTAPYAPLFFYYDELQKLGEDDSEENSGLKDDLIHLADFYSRRIKPAHDVIKQDQANNLVIFKDLWALFRPGDLIYTLDPFGEPTIHMLDATEYRPGQRSQETYSITRFRRFSADLWSMTFDRATGRFQRIILTRSIKSFSDARPISSLPFYPLSHYRGDIDQLRATLQKRGRWWKELVSQPPSCKSYDGPARQHGITFHDSENLCERVLVDGSASSSLVGTSRRVSDHPSAMSGLMGGTTYQRIEYEYPVYGAGLSSMYDDFDDFDPKNEFSDLQAELCPATVVGYALQRRCWYEIQCSKVAEVDWAPNTMENLVIDEKTKRTLVCLVDQHKKNRGRGLSDIIKSKGKGLIVVLHGNPGVGKTLTAEAVAEHTRKPLYPINIGELTHENDIVGQLAMHFGRASRWDAVLLMDEADVLLEKRSYENLNRNAIVSVFLRMLEYYEGILFLTTNRLLTMDSAFESRIQLAIRLPDLGPESRRLIWTNLIRRLDADEEEGKAELMSHLDDMAEWELNGRQIRNILTMAESLALGSQRRRGALRYKLVENMANEAISFRDFFEDGAQERKAQLGIVNPRQFQERRSRW
ncbi:P-loop containing nucleoside triphosphate hydrolase protein [Cercophora newfieldiana]|uniref:P-loop containing nucleoside triphosphate hydrolase protein n=1 Tax=Cercophora newfieldiana TaxID=92897 RepID=A0AA39Y0Z3_9PEZI|nr:P-loop containing nucleoside triphosphate hydrolase protein [Cercophora newfieldiana]